MLRQVALVIFPLIAAAVWVGLIVAPSTGPATMDWISHNREQNPIEIFTAGCFFVGGVLAAITAIRATRESGWSRTAQALLLFSLAAIIVCLEEISYGQHVFGFATPDLMETMNAQGEMTLHNINGVHGHAGTFFYLPFAIIALVGMRAQAPHILSRVIPLQDWKRLQVPKIFLPLTIVILLLALPKIVHELISDSKGYIPSIRWTTEIVEALMSLWVLGYAIEKFRALARDRSFDGARVRGNFSNRARQRGSVSQGR